MEEGGLALGAFNFVDLAAGAYLLWGLVRGFRRGLSRELFRLITILVAVGAGWRLYRPFGEKIAEVTRLAEQGSGLMAFVLSFLAAGFAMVVLRWVLRNLAEFSFKGQLERLGGAAAGLLRCGLVAAAVISVCSLCPIDFISTRFAEGSLFGRVVNAYLLPAYTALAEGHPELDLPLPGPQGDGRQPADAAGPSPSRPAGDGPVGEEPAEGGRR
jgi:membrane protein required for colicin V production